MTRISMLLGLVLGLTMTCVVNAQSATPAAAGSPASTKPDMERLVGAWVRPDGGYLILIRKVETGGQLEAMYFNPRQLPFAKAQATLDGTTLRASFEIRAGGYNGSTYELVYDPGSDRLRGIYYQAVAKQKFEVYFARK